MRFKFLRNSVLKSPILLLLFIILNSALSYSQDNCNCTDENNDLEITEYIKKDSTRVFKKINSLKKSTFKGCYYKALNIEFKYYNDNLLFNEALKIIKEQEELFKTLDCKNDFYYDILRNKTRYYHAINDFENLSDFAYKSINEAKRLNDIEKEFESIQALVFVFTRLSQDEKIKDYLKRAVNIIKEVKNQKLYVKYNRWLAYEYENQYNLTERKTLLDSILLFTKRAKKEAFKLNMNQEIARLYRVEESVAYYNNDFKKALRNIDSAIYYAKKIEDIKHLGTYYLYKAYDHLELKEKKQAIIWADSAIYYTVPKNTLGASNIYFQASDIYEESGQSDIALKTYRKYTSIKDSVLNLKTLEKVSELEQKYNKIANENKIVVLEKTKQSYFFLIIAALLTLLVLIFFFRQRTIKNRQKILETQQRLNRARMDPHFFFNAMTSLQHLSIQEKSPKTSLHTARLAKIMRQSLESTYEDLTTIEEEIDFLTQYLEIQKLRYPNKFIYKFHLSNELEINELRMPSMLIQPFVENAIEHGFKNLDRVGKLDITFKGGNHKINVTVEDDGNGLTNISKNKTHKSRAMQIIGDRLFLFNKKHKSDASYKIINVKKSGFKIVIILPKIY